MLTPGARFRLWRRELCLQAGGRQCELSGPKMPRVLGKWTISPPCVMLTSGPGALLVAGSPRRRAPERGTLAVLRELWEGFSLPYAPRLAGATDCCQGVLGHLSRRKKKRSSAKE